MNYPRTFDARDFCWTGPDVGGSRALLYRGLAVVIQIAMRRSENGAQYEVDDIEGPRLRPADHAAFVKCGGVPALVAAARSFANSRRVGR